MHRSTDRAKHLLLQVVGRVAVLLRRHGRLRHPRPHRHGLGHGLGAQGPPRKVIIHLFFSFSRHLFRELGSALDICCKG